MQIRRWISALLIGISCLDGAAASADDWHGSGWLGSPWGIVSDGFRRDPIVGVYGRLGLDFDPYASYRNDNGCFRILPVRTQTAIRLRRVFVCDF